MNIFSVLKTDPLKFDPEILRIVGRGNKKQGDQINGYCSNPEKNDSVMTGC